MPVKAYTKIDTGFVDVHGKVTLDYDGWSTLHNRGGRVI